ncbi:MAG TPA: prephenate dehydratase [Gammaproteobacteria bacterium]|nr:prephenate dehydratase [Gammaproteobacteria bacterium]
MRVSYLGPNGSFTQIALIKYFSDDTKQISKRTIDDVFKSVEIGEADYGVVPIENSFEGSVNNTHDLLIDSSINIYDEIQLRIRQCLISKADDINQIDKVYSHPQSFAQCQNWLKANLPSADLVPVFSNSEAAEIVSTLDEACIGSKILAKLYGLNLIKENIEDSKENTTRFVILSHKQQSIHKDSKVSLIITPPDSDASGSLYNLLKPFASEDINLLRIESRPYRGKLWSYVFFIDCQGSVEDKSIQNAIESLKSQNTNVKVLGCYPSHNNQ